MKSSSIGTFALRFAAIAFLFASAVAAQTPGIGQSVCRDVDWGRRVCDTVYYPPMPPPPPEPPVQHTTGSETNVQFDPAAEARKAKSRATEHRAPASSSLCPPPYRMTASDGCQR